VLPKGSEGGPMMRNNAHREAQIHQSMDLYTFLSATI